MENLKGSNEQKPTSNHPIKQPVLALKCLLAVDVLEEGALGRAESGEEAGLDIAHGQQGQGTAGQREGAWNSGSLDL
jgi:hypothetical protein